jgi:gas vesicle protein
MNLLLIGVFVGVIAGALTIGLFAGARISELESKLRTAQSQNQMYQKDYIENNAKRKVQNEKTKKRSSA